MTDATYLTGQLLIAMPLMVDPNFHRTVTYICDHSEQGALGLVINRSLGIELSEIFDLYGVIVHAGGSRSFGHYYSYCRGFDDKWYKCNDETIS